MKKICRHFFLLGFLFCFQLNAGEISAQTQSISSSETTEFSDKEKEEIVTFTPPKNWRMADISQLTYSHVKSMVIGQSPSIFPPSINLCSEPYKATLQEYLKMVKNRNRAQGNEWKNLGVIQTEAGNANLSQVDIPSQWGNIRHMHVILVKNENVYILTAAALKNEFSLFYKNFFAAMRSLKIFDNIYEMIENPQDRSALKAAAHNITIQWQTLLNQKTKELPNSSFEEIKEKVFKSSEFQNIMKVFTEMLNKRYSHLGTEWLAFFQQKLEDRFFAMKM